jgi:hypothetical protein
MADASSSGLRVRAVDSLARPDAFRIVVEVDARVEAGLGTPPLIGNFGVALADGQATIERIQRVGDLQLGTHTTVAIDHSLSFRKFATATDAILSHLAGRMQPEDSMSLLLFGYEKTEFPVRMTSSDFVADLNSAQAVAWDRHTRLLAHLEEAIQHAGGQKPDGTRQVLLVTDGDEESSAYDKEQIIALARSLGVRVQTLIFKPSQAEGSGKLTGIDNLRVVSRQTGGEPFEYSGSTVSETATAAAIADLDGWLDANRRLLAIDVVFRCLSRASLENTVRVETPGGAARTAWSENHPFTESPSEAMYAACEGSELPDCPAWQIADLGKGACVAKVCAADADCAPGTCDAVAALCLAPVRPGPMFPSWLVWVVGGAIALLLLLLLLALRRAAREGHDDLPADPSPPPLAPAEPVAPSGSEAEPESDPELPSAAPPVAPAEALPDLPEIHLRVSAGEYRGRKYRLFKTSVQVGGDRKVLSNDHVFDITTVSGRHAEFQTFPSGDLWVRDLESSNGTTVNGQRLSAGQKLKIRPGDQVGLGPDLLFVVERPGAAPAPMGGPVPVLPPAPVPPSDDSSLPAGSAGDPEGEAVAAARIRANRKKTIIE